MTFATSFTSFTLGLLAIASPCVLPLYPGFLAYMSAGQVRGRSRYFLGIFILLGVLAMMMLVGLIIATLSISVGRALSVIIPLADLLLVAQGGLLLFNKNPFKAFPQIHVPAFKKPLINALVYGMLYGPITFPCSGPLLVGIFSYSLAAVDVVARLSVFLWFSLGFGLPLLVISFLSGIFQIQVTRFLAAHSRMIDLAGGILLVGIGVYNFLSNWHLIRLFLNL